MSEAEQNIRPFLFEGETLVRVIDIDHLPWFVAADVCRVIGVKNPTQAASRLDDDERSMFNIGRQGDALIINESGLYTLILRSDDAIKPGTAAHRFRKWVTSEVLPAIRATGQYQAPARIADQEDEDGPNSPDGMKLRKVNTAARVFGERAGAQLWAKLGLEMVPAMRPALAQYDMLEVETVSVTRTITTQGGSHQ